MNMSKICPLLGMVTEEGHLSPVGCYGKKCALWDSQGERCHLNSMGDALQTISKILEASQDVF